MYVPNSLILFEWYKVSPFMSWELFESVVDHIVSGFV